MLSSDQKGSIAEIEIAAAAIRLGVEVFRPLSDGTRYDLIFDTGPRLLRVQCKWAVRCDEIVIVRCYSCRRSSNGQIRRIYSPDQVDAFAAYCAELDRCFLLPISVFPSTSQIYLRLAPPRNKQRASVNWADDFSFEARLSRPGAVAQLEEHPAGSRKVRGSNPLGSTTVGAHEFRNHFGWYMERAAAGEQIAVTRRGKPSVRLTAAHNAP